MLYYDQIEEAIVILQRCLFIFSLHNFLTMRHFLSVYVITFSGEKFDQDGTSFFHVYSLKVFFFQIPLGARVQVILQ